MVFWQNNTQGVMVLASGIQDAKNGGGGVTKAGPGTIIFDGNSNYTGATNIQGGTLQIASNVALGGSASNQANVNLDNGALIAQGNVTLDNSAYVSPATLDRQMILGQYGGTLAAVVGATLTVDGSISGSGSLNIGGGAITQANANALNSTISFVTTSAGGTVALSGNNSYTGNTTIALSGQLRADGAFASPRFIVNGLLSGTPQGSLNNVTVNSNGTLFAGDSGVGGMTVQSLALNTGSSVSFAISPNTLLTTDPVAVTSATGLSILGTNASPASLAIFSQGGSAGFKTSGTYILLSENGLSDFNINGILALPSGNVSESTNVIAGLQLANPQSLTTYSLVTANVGSNTDLELKVVGPQLSGWARTGGGSYQDPTSWSPQIIPQGVGATANFGAAIQGASMVTIDNQLTVGNFNFNNANSYTLAPGIAGSTIDLNNGLPAATINDFAGQHVIATPITNPNGLNITVTNPSDSITISSPISGAGGITIAGSGTLILTAGNTFGGSTIINSGALQLGNGSSNGTFGPNAGPIIDNGTIVFDQSSGTTQTVTNVLTTSGLGSGSISQLGAGSLVVLSPTGANNLNSGAVTVSAGTLRIGNANAASLGALTLTGGAVDLNGINTGFTGLSGTGGIIDSTAGTGTVDLTVGANNLNTTFAGVIQNSSGSLSLQKLGSGVLVLAGLNTYTGITNIANGGIRITNSDTINRLSQIDVNSAGVNAAGALILSSGVVLANPIVANASANEFVDLPDAGSTATLSGPITTAAGSQYRIGFPNASGTLTVTGASTVPAGGIAILTEGNLVFSGTGSISTSNSTFYIGRATSPALNLTLNNQSSLTNLGTVGMSLGNGFDGAPSYVTQNDQSSINAGTGGIELDGSTYANFFSSLTLNGGTTTAGGFTMSGTSTAAYAYMNFNGGVLTASANNTNFLPASPTGVLNLNIYYGGAQINTNGFNIAVASAPGFNADDGTGNPTGGGLIKLGTGQLAFTSGFGTTTSASYANVVPYNGATIVDGGLLEFANGSENGQFSQTHITVNPGGAAGVDDGSTADAAFLGLMTAAGAPASQQGALALSSADASKNIIYASGATSGSNFFMNTPVAGSNTSFAAMSIGATGNFNGSTYSPTVFTGRITPANHQYLLGGGGTLEMAQTSTGVPLIDVGGATGLLAENGGQVLLVTANTYTGPTIITGVNVLSTPAANLPSGVASYTLEPTVLSVMHLSDANSSIGLSNPATASNLLLSGGVLQYLGAGDTSNRLFSVGSLGGTLDASGSGALNLAATGADGAPGISSTSLTLTGSYGIVQSAAAGASAVNILAGALSDPSGGTLSVVKNGPGAWALTNSASTYTGGTTINAGVLEAGGPTVAPAGGGPGGVFGAAGPMAVNTGATLDLNGNSVSVGALSGAGLIDSIAAPANSGPILTVGAGGAVGTFAGIIQNTSGTVGLVAASGGGRTVLTGNNSYSGSTTINSGGTLQLGNGGAIGGINPASNVLDSGTLVINRSDSTTFTNVITLTGGVTVSGPGTVTFTASNTYSGGTTISAGTVRPGNANALGTGVLTNNSLLDLNGVSLTVGGLAGSGTVDDVSAGLTPALRVNDTTATATLFSGAIQNTTGVVSLINAAGTLILAGANTYSGGTTISGGNLSLGAGGTAGSVLGQITDGGVLTIDRGDANLQFSNLITNGASAGSVVVSGSGTVTFTASNTYSGGTTISAGAVRPGNGNALGSGLLTDNSLLDLNGVSLTVGGLAGSGTVDDVSAGLATALTLNNSSPTSLTFSGTIQNSSGTVSLVAAGTGTTVFTGNNSYVGTTTINSGSNLQLGAGGTTGAISPSSNILDSGTLVFNRTDNITFGNVVSLSGGVTQAGAGTVSFTGSNTYGGTTVVNGGTLILTGPGSAGGGASINGGLLQFGNGGTSGALAGAIANNGKLNINRSDASLALSNSISGNGTVTLTGSGTVTLSGVNTYTGTTTVNAGALVIPTATAINAGNQIADNSSLIITGGTSTQPVVLGASGVPGITSTAGATLTVGTTGAPGYLRLAAGEGAVTLTSLTINSGSSLDITKINSLIVNYGNSADPFATIRGYLKSAYNSGIWTGAGLTSSSVAAEVAGVIAAHTGGVYGIGYADGGKDAGQHIVAAHEIYYAPALVGDANLDGSVTFIDLGIVAQNLGATNDDWEHGDFNYDGTTNFLDIGLLAQNLSKTILNTPLGEMVPDPSAALTAQWNLAVAEIQANQTQPADLPEPGTMGLLVAGAAGLLTRRRRRTT